MEPGNLKANNEAGKPEKPWILSFGGWMKKLAAAFNQEVSEERIAVYASTLGDLSVEQLDAACQRCLEHCRFFPTISEIREQVHLDVKHLDQFNAEVAWGIFRENFRSWFPDVGVTGKPKPLGEAGEYAALLIGGYGRFAASELAHENFIRSEFIAAYQRYRDTGGYLAPTREQAAALLEKLRGELPE